MRIARPLYAGAAAMALATGMMIAAPQTPAYAGHCTIIGPIHLCGSVKNWTDVDMRIATFENGSGATCMVYQAGGKRWPCYWCWLLSGQTSPGDCGSRYKDTDGFMFPDEDWIGPEGEAVPKGQYYKIIDNMKVNCFRAGLARGKIHCQT